MIAVAWRLICVHPSGWLEPLSEWGSFDETESRLAQCLIAGMQRLRLQSSREVAMRGERREWREEWWLDRSNVAALYRWMVDNGYLDGTDVNAVHYYLQRSEKYTLEWQLMTTGRLSTELAVAEPEPEADPFPSETP